MIEFYTISIILLLLYAILIARYGFAWTRISEPGTNKTNTNTGITVLVPCRNEEQNLLPCLTAIAEQGFPSSRFEILVIDDHSEDKTAEMAQQFFKNNPKINGQVLSLAQSGPKGKKEAITFGVRTAIYPLVVTTDADCIAPTTWLQSLVSYYEATKCKMMVAPVKFSRSSSLVQQLQELEFLGLQTVTGGGIELNEPVLCNGANLCYEKEAFIAVGGYNDNSTIQSGDDLFIMHKISKAYPGEIKYLKSRQATVHTEANASATQFFGQRKRWVSKVISIPDLRTIVVAFIVYLTNLSLIINLVVWLLLPDFSGSFLIITFGAKALIDFLFLHLAASYFDRRNLLRIFVLAEIINVVYVAVIGLLGNIGKYKWKGRTSDRTSFVSNNS